MDWSLCFFVKGYTVFFSCLLKWLPFLYWTAFTISFSTFSCLFLCRSHSGFYFVSLFSLSWCQYNNVLISVTFFLNMKLFMNLHIILHRGHANLFCVIPILIHVLLRQSLDFCNFIVSLEISRYSLPFCLFQSFQ